MHLAQPSLAQVINSLYFFTLLLLNPKHLGLLLPTQTAHKILLALFGHHTQNGNFASHQCQARAFHFQQRLFCRLGGKYLSPLFPTRIIFFFVHYLHCHFLNNLIHSKKIGTFWPLLRPLTLGLITIHVLLPSLPLEFKELQSEGIHKGFQWLWAQPCLVHGTFNFRVLRSFEHAFFDPWNLNFECKW